MHKNELQFSGTVEEFRLIRNALSDSDLLELPEFESNIIKRLSRAIEEYEDDVENSFVCDALTVLCGSTVVGYSPEMKRNILDADGIHTSIMQFGPNPSFSDMRRVPETIQSIITGLGLDHNIVHVCEAFIPTSLDENYEPRMFMVVKDGKYKGLAMRGGGDSVWYKFEETMNNGLLRRYRNSFRTVEEFLIQVEGVFL